MNETGAKDPTPGEDEVSLLLDDQMCFALYAAQRALTNRYRPLLEEFNLTYPQYLVMLVLWEHSALPIRTLGKLLQLDYGTLTPLLKRLQTHGLVRRERQASDERSVLISLTDQGAELRERARVIPAAIGQAAGLTPSEVGQVKSLLEHLTESVAASQ
ncbi:MarR family winged helix-turn-helix transcriptional regulator [Streptomyces sp. NPDC048448]|uniref:MarR family winged helix-turn-helix transcriptional regulator n=1 Tax=Streptomyces sp. NPDC048448 TaxID=3365554 RepID=UPI0037210F20